VESRPVAVDTATFLRRSADDGMARELAEHAVRPLAPMEDHVATADYRAALARVLTRRVVLAAAAQARKGRPQ
jgi:CO/xanthine dehydrogenase FAD-binding subunit